MNKSIRRLRRLPIDLRIALMATCALFALNVVWAYSQGSWKIDPGTATLCGAIIGLAIIGQQTRKGFGNLIRSQNLQAELDREARLHKADIERAAEEAKRKNDRDVLLSAMWAESVTVWKQVVSAENNARIFGIMHEGFHKERMPVIESTKIVFPKITAPVFIANISSLGLLGSSLAADVVAVLSRADGQGLNMNAAPALGHQMIQKIYEANSESMKHWRQDLYHVAIRIDAILNGRPDPGGLQATEEERRKGA